MLSCRSARRALETRSDDRLGLELGFELDAHLEHCDACRSYASSLQRIEDAWSHLPEPPLHRLNVEDSVLKIRARVEAAEVRPEGERAPLRRRGTVVIALAAAAFLVLFAMQRESGDVPPRTKHEPITQTEESLGSQDLQASEALVTAPIDAAPTLIGPVDAVPSARTPVDGDPIDASPIDTARLQETREQVAALLLDSFSQLKLGDPKATVEDFSRTFDLRSLPLKRGDWPVRRLVERLLESPDMRTGRAAARYLGVRGDNLSQVRLVAALEHEPIRRDVCLALRDSGADGLMGLKRALMYPHERQLAIESILQVRSSAAAVAFADTITMERKQRLASTDLILALTQLQAVAFPSLFELAAHGVLTPEELVAALEPTPEAKRWLVQGFASREAMKLHELRLRVAAQIAPEECCLRLEELVHKREYSEFSLELLPQVPGTAPVASLIRLSDDARLSSEDMQRLLRDALRQNSAGFAEHALRLMELGDSEACASLAELLIAADSDDALPAVRVLYRAPTLPQELGQDLVLVMGELGDAHDVDALLELFAQLGAADRHFAASCLISIFRLGGDAAVEEALHELNGRQLSNILDLLRRRNASARTTPSIYKLARELKPVLSERALQSWRSSS